jgi:copper homeostasis protein
VKQLEIACCNIESVLNANIAGASRIELFENLMDGGCTPSYGMIKQAKEISNIPVYVMIRPRGGGFIYSQEELKIMIEDIEMCHQLGADGIVFGALDASNEIDEYHCNLLMSAWHHKPATFHRAFDTTRDLVKSAQLIIHLGFERILTSGGMKDCEQGLPKILELKKMFGDKISIMAGGGITRENVHLFSELNEIHATCKKTKLEEGMFGGYYYSDRELIEEMQKSFIES